MFARDGRIFRTIMASAAPEFAEVEKTGLLQELEESGRLVPWSRISKDVLGPEGQDAEAVLEHSPLAFISHPYEWSFGALRAAALLHLDIQLAALERGVVLSDASAYNIQFNGPNPIFIDHLSFKPYVDGMYWQGHRQFCEQFLNPLLLNSYCGISHQNWYRGSLEGIPATLTSSILPWWHKFSPRVLTNIILPARFEMRNQRRATPENTNSAVAGAIQKKKFPRPGYQHMLTSLRNWIQRLSPSVGNQSVWRDYATSNSYGQDQADQKASFVAKFATTVAPSQLWDLGCNTGNYSKIALENGAAHAIGFEYDMGGLEVGFQRAVDEKLDFLPLYLDVANPSPSQGWRQQERLGLAERRSADAVVALALIHHMCIGRNIPIASAIDWIVDLAPQGVIEFVPKSDPMAIELLMMREDIFDDYTMEAFDRILSERADIVAREKINDSDRQLIWYKRR